MGTRCCGQACPKKKCCKPASLMHVRIANTTIPTYPPTLHKELPGIPYVRKRSETEDCLLTRFQHKVLREHSFSGRRASHTGSSISSSSRNSSSSSSSKIYHRCYRCSSKNGLSIITAKMVQQSALRMLSSLFTFVATAVIDRSDTTAEFRV